VTAEAVLIEPLQTIINFVNLPVTDDHAVNPLTPTVAIWAGLSTRVPRCQKLQMTA